MTRQTAAPLAHWRMNASNRTAQDLVRSHQDNGYLLIDTPYQRGSVWTEDQRIALVRSWLLGVPIPALILNDRMAVTWQRAHPHEDGTGPAYAVIDGKPRLETAIAWFGGRLAVPASWFDSADVEVVEDTDDGPYVRYPGLSVVRRRFFGNQAMLPCATAQLATVEQEAEVYLLVNGGGTPQTDADMANARRVAEGGA